MKEEEEEDDEAVRMQKKCTTNERKGRERERDRGGANVILNNCAMGKAIHLKLAMLGTQKF